MKPYFHFLYTLKEMVLRYRATSPFNYFLFILGVESSNFASSVKHQVSEITIVITVVVVVVVVVVYTLERCFKT
jgi:hypothetical protein